MDKVSSVYKIKRLINTTRINGINFSKNQPLINHLDQRESCQHLFSLLESEGSAVVIGEPSDGGGNKSSRSDEGSGVVIGEGN